jgi:hypothetical protein
MAELSKQALIVDNNQSFPNNNAGAITPDVLRSYNRDVIDSTVNQSVYNADSASFLTLIDNTDTTIGNLVATASVNVNVITFTKDNGSTFDLSVTASVPTIPWDNVTSKPSGLVSGSSQVVSILGPLNAFSASQITKDSTLASYTGSINAFTSSQNTKNTTLATYTGSNDTKWSNLGSQSGSFVTESETGSFARVNVSNTFTANQNITGDLNITGTITATTIHTITESASVIFSSGSNVLGDSATADTQTLNGIVKVSGSQQITGSLTQTAGTNTLNGATTINANTIIGNSGTLNVSGQIQAQSGLVALNGSGIDLQSNVEGSGSAFASITNRVDTTSDPSNVYAGIQLVKPNGDALLNLAVNSYSPQYGGSAIPMILADGNNPGGDNTAIGFTPNGGMDVWKKSNFKYGVDVTGSINQLNGTNTINGETTINNNTTIGNNGTLNVTGQIIGNGGLVLQSNGAGIDLRSNAEGSGSAYSGITTKVDNTSDPTNVYSSYQLVDDQSGANFAMAWNSYTGLYGTSTPVLIANQQYNGSDVAFGFPTNTIDVWKPSTFKAPTIVSGSARGNVNGVTLSTSTASLDFNTSNFFTLTLPGGDTRIEAVNVKPGQTITLKVSQDALGAGTVTMAPQFKFPQFSAYTASLASNAVDILTFVTFDDTSSVYSAAIKNLI